MTYKNSFAKHNSIYVLKKLKRIIIHN